METSSDVRNHMFISALLSTILIPGCDALSSAGPSVALQAVLVSPPVALRAEGMQSRMGSTGEEEGTTGGDGGTTSTTGGGEVGGTSGGMMPVEDTDGGTSGGAGSSTGDDTTGEPEDCPWWGCDGLPGENWLEIITDCSYPAGRPDIGDARCPSPKRCLKAAEFEPDPEAAHDDDSYFPGHWERGICTIPCEFATKADELGHWEPCQQITNAMDPYWKNAGHNAVCGSNEPDGEMFCTWYGTVASGFYGVENYDFATGIALKFYLGPYQMESLPSWWYSGMNKVCPDGFDPVEDCGLDP